MLWVEADLYVRLFVWPQHRGGWTLSEGEQHFSDVPAGNSFHSYIETAYRHGIINGYTDGTFRPQSLATRGQIAKIVGLALTGDR